MKDSPQHAVKYVECACAGVEGSTKPFPMNDTANVASFCLSKDKLGKGRMCGQMQDVSTGYILDIYYANLE